MKPFVYFVVDKFYNVLQSRRRIRLALVDFVQLRQEILVVRNPLLVVL